MDVLPIALTVHVAALLAENVKHVHDINFSCCRCVLPLLPFGEAADTDPQAGVGKAVGEEPTPTNATYTLSTLTTKFLPGHVPPFPR